MKRRVFVTGGAHGIGKGIVEAFARQGDEVVFCDLDPVLGTQTAAETGAQFCQLDVTDAVSLERCMRELFDTWGDIDILVNNVGISPLAAHRTVDRGVRPGNRHQPAPGLHHLPPVGAPPPAERQP